MGPALLTTKHVCVKLIEETLPGLFMAQLHAIYIVHHLIQTRIAATFVQITPKQRTPTRPTRITLAESVITIPSKYCTSSSCTQQ